MTAYPKKRIDANRIKNLLIQALPPVASNAEPARDLWPAVLRCLDAAPTRALHASPPQKLSWFDWALIAGLIVFAASFPATIPVILYYL
jgi:hypothetical protein